MGGSPEIINWGLVTEVRPLTVIKSQKQIGLVVKYNYCGEMQKGLYRPERAVFPNLDTRVPYPSEIYRDVAYHQIDKLLGWNITVPITPWTMKEDDKGVLRQYWDNVDTWQDYHYSQDNMNDRDFWTKTAVLDYVCGVVDRNPNDILFITGTADKKVADSGLSFVDELDFTSQHSRVREELSGQPIKENILNDLAIITTSNLSSVLSEHVNENDLSWVARRAKFIRNIKVVI